jgi:RNA exonuclease 4
MLDEEELQSHIGVGKKKRSRRRRKPRSTKTAKDTPVEKVLSKRPHDAPMTKRDLYFSLHCGLVSIGHGFPAVARVTMINWDAEVILDTFVQVPVPVTDFRDTGITADAISTRNPQAMSFAKVRQSVNQILKGKILVGYRLHEHLTALGLMHPPSDVRDVSQFQMFQNEDVDETTQQSVVVERPLADLAVKFLQREIESPGHPMNMCIASLDLYKKFRKEWETAIVRYTWPNNTSSTYPSRLDMATPTRSVESQARSGVDGSVYSNSGFYAATQQRGSSWFNRSRMAGRVANEVRDQNEACPPVLTSENLEMHSCSGCLGGTSLYAQHHPFHGHPASVYGTLSELGSSTYHESSSAMSEYSYASESVTTSMHDGSLPDDPSPSVLQSSSSTSWFRFGSRKSRYPLLQTQQIPMISWEEEPDDRACSLEHASRRPLDCDEEKSTDSEDPANKATDKAPVEEEKSLPSSWFSFRRPRSPGPGTERSAATQSRNRLLKGVEPEGAARSLGDSSHVEPEADESLGVERYDVSLEEKSSSSWFAFRRSKSPGPERSATPTRRRRSSMGNENIPNNVQSTGRQSNPGVISRRNSFDNISSAPHNEESDKSSTSVSWFSFRRSSKPPVGAARDRDSKGDPTVLLPQPTHVCDDTEDDNVEDWILEVVGSQDTQAKVLLGLAWPAGSSIGFETQLAQEENQSSTPNASKESKWLPRFLRSSKPFTTEPTPPEEDAESSSREQWLQVPVRPADYPKTPLHSARFPESEVGLRLDSSGFTRDRLETEATLPTISSEDASQLDDSSSSSDDVIAAMAQDMGQNFAYLTL